MYLHGFASSPRSRKARFFQDRLASCGLSLETPALDGGDFERLTITTQLNVVQRAAGTDPVVLVGSSLGGYVAALYAATHSSVRRLLLLAPAFCFHDLWIQETGPERLSVWRQKGSAPVFHYGEGRELPIGYQLIEDAAKYDPWPHFSQPALIFHGNQDASVPVQYSVQFVQHHSNAILVRMASGHELTDVLDDIWSQSVAFILGG